MGNKKREASSTQQSGVELVENKDLVVENAVVEPLNKRMKKDKKKKDIEIPKSESEYQNGTNGISTSTNAHKVSFSSMEKRKHRKLLDKERHRAGTRKIESAPEKMDIELKNDSALEKMDMELKNDSAPEKMDIELKNDGNESASTSNSSGGVLPEFHIGVFKDLAAADLIIREAAAKALVMELREVQNAYNKLVNKDEVEDKSKLEAEKDDGLNNCAPSLRYAVRRLIRGVSSSREVRFLFWFKDIFVIFCLLNCQGGIFFDV